MRKKITASNSYKDLILGVQATLSTGLLTAQKALEYQRLRTYWEIGNTIRNSVALSKGSLQLGGKLYLRETGGTV